MTWQRVGRGKGQSTAFLAVKSHFGLQMILLTCTRWWGPFLSKFQSPNQITPDPNKLPPSPVPATLRHRIASFTDTTTTTFPHPHPITNLHIVFKKTNKEEKEKKKYPVVRVIYSPQLRLTSQ